MKQGFSFFLAALFVAVAFTGCINAPDTVDTANVDPVAPGAATGTRANVYMAPAPGPHESHEDMEMPVLPAPDVSALPFPLPLGLQRSSPFASFEPTLGVDSQGRVYLSSFAGATGSRTFLARTDDGGLSWTDVTPRLGPVSLPPQSNDPYVYVDPTTDRIFLSDLQALMCATLSYSDDGGDSWVTNPVGCGQPLGVHDHQSVFAGAPRVVTTVGYPNVVYYCINRVADTSCATSLNGGLTFGPLVTAYAGVEAPESGPELCGGLAAHGTTSLEGTVYLPKAQCGRASVAISENDGLTWDVVTIDASVPVKGHEVAFAVDEVGNAYAFWIGTDRLPYLAVSADAGRTWSAPVMVAPADVKTTDFPTIAAGADGRIAMAYYGTTTDGEYAEMAANDTWNAYITIVTDALAETPMLMTVTANDPSDPVARGICGNTRCNGVGDFIDIVIDAEGRPWAAFVDVCNAECAAPDGETNLGSFGFVGTLVEGPRLRGDLGALPALPLVGEAKA